MTATEAPILLKAAELLRKDGWCQGDTRIGRARCAEQAVYDTLASHDGERFEALRRRLESELDLAVPLWMWNDQANRTMDEVIALLTVTAEGMSHDRDR